MSVVDKLLKLDSASLAELPVGTIEIKRLSEKIGEPFLVECKAINGQRYNDIQKNAVRISKKGEFQDLDTGKTKTLTVLEGIVEPNLKREDLQQHYKAATPKELLYKMFLAGEVDDIYNLILDLSGFEGNSDEESLEDEIKN